MTEDYDWLFSDNRQLETDDGITPAFDRKEYKRRQQSAMKKERLSEFYQSLPAIGESLHIISNGSFDYFNFAPLTIGMLGGFTEYFYGSTWTMSRGNVIDIMELFDSGQVGAMAILTGTYFKRRETAVYATLMEGLTERGQRFVAFRNHAKVMLLNNGDDYITVEGSANFTANPRTEQTTVTNDRQLWDFHRRWMEEMLSKSDGKQSKQRGK